jgi:putative protease
MNGRIFPDRMNDVFVGARIFRNWDQSFQMTLQKKTSERKIPVSLVLEETQDGFSLKYQDDTNQPSSGTSYEIIIPKIPANDPDKSRENIRRQLSKSGDTAFLVREIHTGGNEKYFFTSQQLNELRRGFLDSLLVKSVDSRKDTFERGCFNPTDYPFPEDAWHFENNISNQLALKFYQRHGLENPEAAVEKRKISGRLQVMITKHCLQYELGFCARFGGIFPTEFKEPFSLWDGPNRFDLEFDCRNCMMRIFRSQTTL